MDIRHIMAQLGIPPMKFAIYSIQTFLADYDRLSEVNRAGRTHNFVTRELPIILDELIKEEQENDRKPHD